MLYFNHLLTSISLTCNPVVSYSGLYHEGRLSLFLSSEKKSLSWWYTPSFLQLLHFLFSPRFIFPLSLGMLLCCLFSSFVFFIVAMNLFCYGNNFFCSSSRHWRSVSFVVVIDAACSLDLSSSDSGLLVYLIIVCWSEGVIWLVVMLVRGLDDTLLTTVTSSLNVREARMLALLYPPCGLHTLH